MYRRIGINVDIGSSETKIVVTGPAGVVHSHILPVAGNAMDKAIARYLEQKYKLLIGKRTAEVLKSELGVSNPLGIQLTIKVQGRRLGDNALETVLITDADIREALADIVSEIIKAVTMAVKSVPAEISAAVAARGIVVRDRGSPLRDIDQRLMIATGIEVRRA